MTQLLSYANVASYGARQLQPCVAAPPPIFVVLGRYSSRHSCFTNGKNTRSLHCSAMEVKFLLDAVFMVSNFDMCNEHTIARYGRTRSLVNLAQLPDLAYIRPFPCAAHPYLDILIGQCLEMSSQTLHNGTRGSKWSIIAGGFIVPEHMIMLDCSRPGSPSLEPTLDD